jgi:hypothetical protein
MRLTVGEPLVRDRETLDACASSPPMRVTPTASLDIFIENFFEKQ